jgi:hypothetical protein
MYEMVAITSNVLKDTSIFFFQGTVNLKKNKNNLLHLQ